MPTQCPEAQAMIKNGKVKATFPFNKSCTVGDYLDNLKAAMPVPFLFIAI